MGNPSFIPPVEQRWSQKHPAGEMRAVELQERRGNNQSCSILSVYQQDKKPESPDHGKAPAQVAGSVTRD